MYQSFMETNYIGGSTLKFKISEVELIFAASDNVGFSFNKFYNTVFDIIYRMKLQ